MLKLVLESWQVLSPPSLIFFFTRHASHCCLFTPMARLSVKAKKSKLRVKKRGSIFREESRFLHAKLVNFVPATALEHVFSSCEQIYFQ